ncbi:MAG: hypothetical protein ACYTEP_08900 [Planctomycetota bacterium]
MKTQLLTTFILTGICGASLDAAQEGPLPPHQEQDRRPGLDDRARQAPRKGQEQGRPDREARRRVILEKFDRDGDGRLNEQERESLRRAMQERRRQRGEQGSGADRRRQGEQRQATEERPGVERTPRFDRRRQGEGETRRRGNPQGQRRSQAGMNPELLARILQRFDRNGNGQLDAEEREALHRAVQQRRADLNPGASSRRDRRARGSADAPPTDRRPSRRSPPRDNR